MRRQCSTARASTPPNMKTSIALATFNGAAYLQAQLDSFAAQTQLPDELVVGDDCSTDATPSIIEAFAVAAPFAVRYHRNEANIGYSANFSGLLARTTGDLVFLCDQDDVWFPEKIAHMCAFAGIERSALAYLHDAELTRADLKRTGITVQGQMRALGRGDAHFAIGCCTAVRRELLDFSLPVPPLNTHDSWLISIAAALHAKAITPRVLQYYRRHSETASADLINHTKKITAVDIWKRGLFEILKPEQRARIDSGVESVQSYLDRLSDIVVTAPIRYRALLQHHISDRRALLRLLRRRKELRNSNLLTRAPGVAALLLAGEYRRMSGIKSAFRDLAG
jgi:glycosyltransferase involved in cell wall biosynthesis